MNGIFIKGASLPENCLACPCNFGTRCFVHPPELDGVIADTVDELCEKGGKPYWCPMVEAEIDKDELVRHGRWIRGASKGWPTNPSCLWYCSCCGEKIRYVDTLRTYQKIKKPVKEVNPYCRKCGAKMDGGDSNEKS